ncbi:hypothetical protein OC842_005783 [Tilletia horrida]|uniref:Uncharacterized protein n=1 Tax=Tilletia horrida TaxID=155126 RepID=A0AAN6JIB6_9BASI|nr:hypothetical protein OC842_005783 [Tilletia horrida]
MRTRRAGPAPGDILGGPATTRSTSTRAPSAAAAASTTAGQRKRKAPASAATGSGAPATAATPSKARSRTTSARTPLAIKNTLSSQPSSNGGAFSGSGDYILSPTFHREQDDPDEEPAKKKSEQDVPERPSLADLVDDALRPIEQPLRRTAAAPTTGRVGTAQASTKSSTRKPSASSNASSSVQAASVASLLSSRRPGKGKVKKTVTAAGFYAQASPAPALPKAPPIASSSKAKAQHSEGSRPSRPAPALVPQPSRGGSKATITAPISTTSSQQTRKPLQPIASVSVPTQKVAISQTRAPRTGGGLFSRPIQPVERRRGMVVWDDDDEDANEKGGHIDDDDDDSDHSDEDKDAVVSDPGSSDKENRDPHATQQSSVSRTAIDAHLTIAASTHPERPGTPPPQNKRTQAAVKARTPLQILADVAPSHSTPLTGSGKAKKTDKGKAPIRGIQGPKLSEILGRSQSSSSNPTLAVPTPLTDVSSSIPASDDVYLYTKTVLGADRESAAQPSPTPAAAAAPRPKAVASPGAVLADLVDDSILDFGSNAEGAPIVQDDAPDAVEEFIDWSAQDEPQAEKDVADFAPAALNNDDSSIAEVLEQHQVGPAEVGAESLSFDPQEDPFGFFAAEAKLRAQREVERVHRKNDVGLIEDDDARQQDKFPAVYGLDLRREEKAFAAPSSPASSDDECEDETASARDELATAGTFEAETADAMVNISGPSVADESVSPVRRSTRVRKQKEPVVEASDSEASKDGDDELGRARSGEGDEDDDARLYDTDVSPPGLIRSAGEVRRRAGLAARTVCAVAADFEETPFDSDDERPSQCSDGSSVKAQLQSKAKGKAKAKAKAAPAKELRLSDLVKLLPKRSSAATYGSKGKSRSGAQVLKPGNNSKTAVRSRTERAETVSDSEESNVSLPSPMQIQRGLKRRPNKDADEEAEKDDVFSSDSEDERPAKKGRGKETTAQSKGGKSRAKKAAVLPAWTRQGAEHKQTRSASGSSRKRGRADSDKEAEKESELSSAGEGEEEAAPPKKKTKAQQKAVKSAAGKAASKLSAKSSKSDARTFTKVAPAPKKKPDTRAQEERPRDELDDFELDTEFVI